MLYQDADRDEASNSALVSVTSHPVTNERGLIFANTIVKHLKSNAIAFCGMDFAGIARLFTPEKGRSEHVEVWYLLAAWFLAATTLVAICVLLGKRLRHE